jgi:hypothetical protein
MPRSNFQDEFRRATSLSILLDIGRPNANDLTLPSVKRLVKSLTKKYEKRNALRQTITTYANSIGEQTIDVNRVRNYNTLYKELRRLKMRKRRADAAIARQEPAWDNIGGVLFKYEPNLQFKWLQATITPEQLRDVMAPTMSAGITYKIVFRNTDNISIPIYAVNLTSDSMLRPYYTLHTILNTISSRSDEYDVNRDGIYTLLPIVVENPQLVGQRDSDTKYNCAIEIVRTQFNKCKHDKNKDKVLRKIDTINDTYYADGIGNIGLQELADATAFKLVIGDIRGNVWHEFNPHTLSGKVKESRKNIYMMAHNNHITLLENGSNAMKSRSDYVSNIMRGITNPTIKIYDTVESLEQIANHLEKEKIYSEYILSKGRLIAIITPDEKVIVKDGVPEFIKTAQICKVKFDECQTYPTAYSDAGVGKMKFLDQHKRFRNPAAIVNAMNNDIADEANISGFYMRLGKSDKNNIKYDMKHAYMNFRDSNLFGGFELVNKEYDISNINIGDNLYNRISHGLMLIEYPPLTQEYLEQCNPIYFEGSGWYPVEIVKAIISTMPKDKQELIKFKRLAMSNVYDIFDIDFDNFTNDQFRGFVGKCEAKEQQAEWRTSDPVEFMRARYILGESVIGVLEPIGDYGDYTPQLDIFGKPTPLDFRVTFLQDKKPWRMPIIPAYIKAHQKYNLYAQYNKIMDSDILTKNKTVNPVKYIAIDGIELDKSVAIPELDELFDKSKWKVEPINVITGRNFVIKRDHIDIDSRPECQLLSEYLNIPEGIKEEFKKDERVAEESSIESKEEERVAEEYKGKSKQEKRKQTEKLNINFIAFLGPAGCGKTHKILEMADPFTLYIGPTNECIQVLKDKNNAITGKTLHKAFGIGCKQDVRLHDYSKIILDEISMVSIDTLIGCIKQLINMNWRGSFYMSGDFCQLLPVNGDSIYNIDKNEFEKKLMDVVKHIEVIHLTKNYRQQNDPEFYEICQELRTGKKLKKETINKLNARVLSRAEIEAIETDALTIAGVNIHVDSVNNKYIDRLDKVGTPIIINKNMPRLNLYNGNMCLIDSYNETTNIITISRGEIKVTMPIDRLKSISNLAYAMTVHKSQGKTIHGNLIINPTRLFAKNHLYVAITRATSLNNIYLTAPIGGPVKIAPAAEIIIVEDPESDSDEDEMNEKFPWLN